MMEMKICFEWTLDNSHVDKCVHNDFNDPSKRSYELVPITTIEHSNQARSDVGTFTTYYRATFQRLRRGFASFFMARWHPISGLSFSGYPQHPVNREMTL